MLQDNLTKNAYRKLHNTTTAIIQKTNFTMEAADLGLIGQAMMVDQSAAFDCVQARILDEKMKIYNFSENTRRWFRSQFVEIGAARSNMRKVKSGVPQGSVLGPILYVLYTNKILETNNDCTDEKGELFGDKNCYKCGIMPCFADGCTVIIRNKKTNHNKMELKTKLESITEFLNNNDLSINQVKPKLRTIW